jgi:hypothetical protein
VLGRTVTSLEDSPAREIALHDSEGEPIKGVSVFLRLLPRPLSEKLIRPAMRKARGKDEDAAEEAISRWMREHMGRALVDTKGFEWGFDDQGAVDAYSVHFPGLKVGDVTSFDGRWSESLKEKFFSDNPAVVALLVDAYKRLAQIGAADKREEEEKKEPISAPGSASA